MALIGESRITNSVLRMIDDESKFLINDYLEGIYSKDFFVMNSVDQVNNVFGNSLNEFLASLSEDELMDLRTWSSYNFTNINAILRNNWTYEVNGELTDTKKKELSELADRISNIFIKYNKPQVDFISFRGTTLGSFKDYGITNLLELENLEGKFLYEQGFTSTSLLDDSCYFNKDFKDSKKYNIKIRYLISSSCEDGVLLINNTSHYSDEFEYLIDKGSLTKVIDVKVNEDSAILTAIVIPKKIYDRAYREKIVNSKSN